MKSLTDLTHYDNGMLVACSWALADWHHSGTMPKASWPARHHVSESLSRFRSNVLSRRPLSYYQGVTSNASSATGNSTTLQFSFGPTQHDAFVARLTAKVTALSRRRSSNNGQPSGTRREISTSNDHVNWSSDAIGPTIEPTSISVDPRAHYDHDDNVYHNYADHHYHHDGTNFDSGTTTQVDSYSSRIDDPLYHPNAHYNDLHGSGSAHYKPLPQVDVRPPVESPRMPMGSRVFVANHDNLPMTPVVPPQFSEIRHSSASSVMIGNYPRGGDNSPAATTT